MFCIPLHLYDIYVCKCTYVWTSATTTPTDDHCWWTWKPFPYEILPEKTRMSLQHRTMFAVYYPSIDKLALFVTFLAYDCYHLLIIY